MQQRDGALGMRTRIVVGLTVSTIAWTGCGKSSPSPAAAVRQSFEQLRQASAARDVGGTCALLAPAGAATVPVPEADKGLLAFQKDCEQGFGRRAEFQSISRGLQGLIPGSVTIRGRQAQLAVSAPGRRPGALAFVLVTNRWRLAFQTR